MAIQAVRVTIRCLAAAVAFAACTTTAMAKQCYAPDQRAQERGFSRIVTTEGGKVLWLAGQTGAPNATFDEQVRGIFAELDRNIRAVGGSGLADMVTMTIFITDTRLGDRFAQLRREAFRECWPASSLITVTGLAQPGLLVEVEGTAVVGGR